MLEEIDAYLCELHRASQPVQTLTLKVGGLPVLLHEIEWPACRECGQPMSFLAQVPLHSPIAFSRKYAMAYVFMCQGKLDQRLRLQCRTWDAFAGANKVILQAGIGRARVPDRAPTYPDYIVTLTLVREPLIDRSDFLVDQDPAEAVSELTKIGGVPAWLQSNDTPQCPGCGGAMRFVAQLNDELDGPLPADPIKWGDERYRFLGFGDSGLGYLFLCENECGANGAVFLWQTT